MPSSENSRATNSTNYIFGYGSLIEKESRRRTTPSAETALPVRVEGIARGWWSPGGKVGYSTTFLGAAIAPQLEMRCNGVIYAVSEQELDKTDEREGLYDRVRIQRDQITMLDGSDSAPDAAIWVYVVRSPMDTLPQPTARHPIVQSYVDICINGCLEIESQFPSARDFAREFIRETKNWNQFWVNDRLYPRRPFIFVPRSYTIDNLLNTELPQLFANVEIQPTSWERPFGTFTNL